MPIRPKSVSAPLKIYEIKLDRTAIDQMPPDARRILFLLGHIANEINTLSRLLIFSVHHESDKIVRMYGEARAATILRLLCGMTFEGLLTVQRSILGSPFGKAYIQHLTKDGQTALDRVRAHLGNTKLIADIRNAYSFHLPTHDQIDQAYSRVPKTDGMSIYSGAARHSSLYEMSHALMMRGMLELVPGYQTMTPEQAIKIIVDDVQDKSVALNELIEQIIIVLVEQHNLSPGTMQDVTTVDGTDSMKTFRIPPLLRD